MQSYGGLNQSRKIHSNLLAGKHLYILRIKTNQYVHQDPCKHTELNIIAGINDALQDTLSSRPSHKKASLAHRCWKINVVLNAPPSASWWVYLQGKTSGYVLSRVKHGGGSLIVLAALLWDSLPLTITPHSPVMAEVWEAVLQNHSSCTSWCSSFNI